MISADARDTWWRYFALRFGFDDSQIRRYTFNLAPFLVNPEAIQQGYVTSEPFMALREGVEAKVFLIADTGWPAYSTLVTVSKALVASKPSVVQRFLNASIEGWYSYLYGDPGPGNRLIKKSNPDMPDALIGYGIAKMKEYGIVDSGDALKLGIGAMTEERLTAFFDTDGPRQIVPGGNGPPGRVRSSLRQQGARARDAPPGGCAGSLTRA